MFPLFPVNCDHNMNQPLTKFGHSKSETQFLEYFHFYKNVDITLNAFEFTSDNVLLFWCVLMETVISPLGLRL